MSCGAGRYDFVLLADSAYARFLDPGNLKKEHQKIYAERYRRLLALPEVFAIESGATRLGPGTLAAAPRPRSGALADGQDVRRRATRCSPARPCGRPGRVRPRSPSPDRSTGGVQGLLRGGPLSHRNDDRRCSVGQLRVVDAANRVILETGDPHAASFALAAPSRLFVQIALEPPAALVGLRIESQP
jgi:hypothetical protein